MVQRSHARPAFGTARSATGAMATGAQIVTLRPGRRRPFAGLFRRRAPAHTAQTAQDATARWILAAPSAGPDSYTEFVIAAETVTVLRPEVVRTLARLGPFPFSLRLRSPDHEGATLELRIGGLDQAAADRIATGLSKVAGARRVRYRNAAFGGEIRAPFRPAPRPTVEMSLAQIA